MRLSTWPLDGLDVDFISLAANLVGHGIGAIAVIKQEIVNRSFRAGIFLYFRVAAAHRLLGLFVQRLGAWFVQEEKGQGADSRDQEQAENRGFEPDCSVKRAILYRFRLLLFPTEQGAGGILVLRCHGRDTGGTIAIARLWRRARRFPRTAASPLFLRRGPAAAPSTMAASYGRFSGSFSINWHTSVSRKTGTSIVKRDGRSKVPLTCLRNISIALSALNGFVPVRSS